MSWLLDISLSRDGLHADPFYRSSSWSRSRELIGLGVGLDLEGLGLGLCLEQCRC